MATDTGTTDLGTAQLDLLRVFAGMWTAQAASTAARLGIPDALAGGGPRSADDLAATLGLHAPSLRRLLRALASVGLFTVEADGRYGITPAGRLLSGSAPGSLKQWFIAETDPVHWRAWERMIDAVRTGEPQPPAAVGTSVFEYYATHPEDAAQFGLAMGDISRLTAAAVVESYDFSAVRRIVDVGGGNGSLVLAVLERYPQAEAVVFDLPHSADHAHAAIAAAGMGERCRFEGGDFFAAVPAGADVQLLKFILHDWNDADAVRLLTRCREALVPGGRVVIVEMLLPDEPRPELVQFMDLNMLVMTGGRERTAADYETLLRAAGLRTTRVIPTGSPFQLIEAETV